MRGRYTYLTFLINLIFIFNLFAGGNITDDDNEFNEKTVPSILVNNLSKNEVNWKRELEARAKKNAEIRKKLFDINPSILAPATGWQNSNITKEQDKKIVEIYDLMLLE